MRPAPGLPIMGRAWSWGMPARPTTRLRRSSAMRRASSPAASCTALVGASSTLMGSMKDRSVARPGILAASTSAESRPPAAIQQMLSSPCTGAEVSTPATCGLLEFFHGLSRSVIVLARLDQSCPGQMCVLLTVTQPARLSDMMAILRITTQPHAKA